MVAIQRRHVVGAGLIALPLILATWALAEIVHIASYDFAYYSIGLDQFLRTHHLPIPTSASGWFYPPPFLVVLAPLASIPQPLALTLVQASSVAALAITILLWVRPHTGRLPGAALVLGCSFAGAELIALGQFGVAWALIALSGTLVVARRDRWALAGIVLGIGSIRFVNALPIGIALLVFAARHRGWRASICFVLGAGSVLLPPTLAVTLLDPAWSTEYLAALRAYPVGTASSIGIGGSVLLLVVPSLLCSLLFRRALNVDVCAASLLVAAMFTPMSAASSYNLVFGLPVLARLATRVPVWVLGSLVALPWIALVLTGARPVACLAADQLALLIAVTLLMRTHDSARPLIDGGPDTGIYASLSSPDLPVGGRHRR